MPNVQVDWKCPPADAGEDKLLGWLSEARQSGETFLKGQRAFDSIDTAFDLIAGDAFEKTRKSLSNLKYNKVKRAIREIVATESNLRPLWGYHTDNQNDWGQQEEILNKLVNAWWHNTFADRSIREALQWGSVGGKSYASPLWDKDFWVAGRGDIRLHVYGPRDVLPVQVGRDHDLQRAYAVILRVETPIAQAHAQWPTFADRLAPSRSRASWLRRGVKAVARWASPALNLAGPRKKEDEEPAFPTIDIYYAYVLDLSINETGQTVRMGRAGSSWEYAVPSFGSDIPTGMKDPKTGGELVRKAGFEDSMLYPLRRLIIATDSCLLNPDPADQTSPFWHGKVPLIPFQMDDWPWEFLGFPLTHDTASMQGSIVNAMRAIDDSANVRLRPPLTYDNRNVSKNFMDRFDPRVPGQTVGMDMLMGELIKPLIPPQYYDVPNWMLEYVKGLEERVDKMMGLNDLVALAKARQVPSADSIEKLMELAGPIVTDMSRGMERSLRDLGEMIKVMFFQFYNTARRIQILGPDGVTEEDWDFEPGNLVPSHMPGEDKASASKTTNIERAKWHANNFVFHVTPNSLHQITQLSRKLLYFQLYKSGFPIDPWTVAEALDLPNFGMRPEGPQTIMGRWIVWLNTQAQLAKEGILPMPPGRGRPSSGNKSPQVQQKDGGARSTMATSR